MYDIIGDIHGYADHLEKLLTKLGYENNSGHYKHPERKAIFVGDFIDRGPKIKKTLSIVKSMVDKDSALATMGNHEFNFLCYNTEVSPGEFLRPHEGNKITQVKQTVKQFEKFEDELNDYLSWFRTLPLFLDLGDIRIVHACWDQEHIKHLNDDIEFTSEFLKKLYENKSGALYKAVDETLKGKEVTLPNGYFFFDKDGKKRFETRIKWWNDPSKSTYDEYFFEEVKELKGKKVDPEHIKSENYYNENDIPVFCGHYWLEGKPELQTRNVACIDYSVAAENNILSAYRWSGEKELKNENFKSVGKEDFKEAK